MIFRPDPYIFRTGEQKLLLRATRDGHGPKKAPNKRRPPQQAESGIQEPDGEAITIVGSGHVGRTYGKLLAQTGHEIILTWSSNAASLERATEDVGHGARNADPAVAVSEAELVLFGPRWEHIEAAARAAGSWVGKLVVDANPSFSSATSVHLACKSPFSIKVGRHPM